MSPITGDDRLVGGSVFLKLPWIQLALFIAALLRFPCEKSSIIDFLAEPSGYGLRSVLRLILARNGGSHRKCYTVLFETRSLELRQNVLEVKKILSAHVPRGQCPVQTAVILSGSQGSQICRVIIYDPVRFHLLQAFGHHLLHAFQIKALHHIFFQQCFYWFTSVL